MNKILSKLFISPLLGMILLIHSCNDDNSINEVDNTTTQSDIPIKSEEIASLDYTDLENIKSQLGKSGIEISNLQSDETEIPSDQTQRVKFCVKALKVSTKTPHPNRSGSYIDISGVLLLPPKTTLSHLSKFRIIVAPPPTYTYNNMAPSNAFKRFHWLDNDFHFNYLAFWTLQSRNGFIVLLPDYPGFGDSYKQCFHPYLDSKAMVTSTLDLLKASQNILSAKGYKYKPDLIITGYSLGGFIAASVARELETNPSHGYKVSLLVTGGTPCNLKQITDMVRKSKKTQHHYFLSYGLWGYKQNAYPYINIDDFLKEPYVSKSLTYFDGTHYDVNEYFSNNPKDIYTEKFITSFDTEPSISYLNTILNENSVKPWKNKCRFIMTHGISDVSVYYKNAYDFYKQQNKTGGKVTFFPTMGDHVSGIIPYYAKATLYTALYK